MSYENTEYQATDGVAPIALAPAEEPERSELRPVEGLR